VREQDRTGLSKGVGIVIAPMFVLYSMSPISLAITTTTREQPSLCKLRRQGSQSISHSPSRSRLGSRCLLGRHRQSRFLSRPHGCQATHRLQVGLSLDRLASRWLFGRSLLALEKPTGGALPMAALLSGIIGGALLGASHGCRKQCTLR